MRGLVLPSYPCTGNVDWVLILLDVPAAPRGCAQCRVQDAGHGIQSCGVPLYSYTSASSCALCVHLALPHVLKALAQQGLSLAGTALLGALGWQLSFQLPFQMRWAPPLFVLLQS